MSVREERGIKDWPRLVTRAGPCRGAPGDSQHELHTAAVGHRGWPLIRGYGTTSVLVLNWIVFVHLSSTDMPWEWNLISARQDSTSCPSFWRRDSRGRPVRDKIDRFSRTESQTSLAGVILRRRQLIHSFHQGNKLL